jgi:hypothetical protein
MAIIELNFNLINNQFNNLYDNKSIIKSLQNIKITKNNQSERSSRLKNSPLP